MDSLVLDVAHSAHRSVEDAEATLLEGLRGLAEQYGGAEAWWRSYRESLGVGGPEADGSASSLAVGGFVSSQPRKKGFGRVARHVPGRNHAIDSDNEKLIPKPSRGWVALREAGG
jgi:hypothetical protein